MNSTAAPPNTYTGCVCNHTNVPARRLVAGVPRMVAACACALLRGGFADADKPCADAMDPPAGAAAACLPPIGTREVFSSALMPGLRSTASNSRSRLDDLAAVAGAAAGFLSLSCAAFSRAFTSKLIAWCRRPVQVALIQLVAGSGGTFSVHHYRVRRW